MRKDEVKLFQISKNKPLQFKRNVLIEKYIDKYLSEQNKIKSSKKIIKQDKEEKKTNCFIKKNPIASKKLYLQEVDDTDATSFLSNYLKKPNLNNRNYPTKLALKTRTMSCTYFSKSNTYLQLKSSTLRSSR